MVHFTSNPPGCPATKYGYVLVIGSARPSGLPSRPSKKACGVDNMMYLSGTELTVKNHGDFTVGLVSLPLSITLRAYP
jgi:hypothetical protein